MFGFNIFIDNNTNFIRILDIILLGFFLFGMFQDYKKIKAGKKNRTQHLINIYFTSNINLLIYFILVLFIMVNAIFLFVAFTVIASDYEIMLTLLLSIFVYAILMILAYYSSYDFSLYESYFPVLAMSILAILSLILLIIVSP